MGAPRIHPVPDGPTVDGPQIAAWTGRPVTEVYADARSGVMPAPIKRAIERGVNAQNWRWSKARILNWIEGREDAA